MKSYRAANFKAADPGRQKANVFRIPEYVRTTHGPDGSTVLDIHRGQLFRINFVGSRILELVKQGSVELQIAEQLTREFGIDRVTAKADVREFLETLEKHHLLAMRDTNSLS